MSDTTETPAERAAVVIPENWQALSWPDMRSLASKLTNEPVTDKAGAVKAIEAAEQARAKAGATVPAAPPSSTTSAPRPKPVPLPPSTPLLVSIPADWHERLSVAEIVALARRIQPDGNPVEVIRAEVARRATLPR